MINIITAIKSLVPQAQFTLVDYKYESINWLDERQKPTESEIQAEIARLQADYDAKQYQRDRAKAYPSIQEQLDMQYWDAINGTTTWQDAINAIKQQFPKGQ